MIFEKCESIWGAKPPERRPPMGAFSDLDVFINQFIIDKKESLKDEINRHLNEGLPYLELSDDAKEIVDNFFKYKTEEDSKYAR